MSAIKKFFENKKLEYKFKKLGAGHSLNETQQRDHQPCLPPPQETANQRQQALSDGAQRAAEAAISRASRPKPGSAALASQKAKIRHEIEAEEQGAPSNVLQASGPVVHQLDSAPMCRVLYRCELFDEDVSFPKLEMETRIESFLTAQLREDPVEAAALMIKTLNKNPDKIQVCVDTIKKILQNIISHPEEEKYLKIRVMNKALRERIFDLSGAREFLLGAGFEAKTLPVDDGASEEEFLVMSKESSGDSEALSNLIEVLENAERICPVLDPDPRLFYPTQKLNAFNVPDEFYAISKEELKKEALLRQEAVEKLGMLRTKAMRERDEQRELRKYRFTAIRARFPNGIILQGTFPARAKLEALNCFIRDSLAVDWLPFNLVAAGAGRLGVDENEKILAELGLVPSAVVNVTFDEDDITQCRESIGSDFYFVKDELISKIEYL